MLIFWLFSLVLGLEKVHLEVERTVDLRMSYLVD